MKVLVINFGTPSTKIFFALIKKIFLHTLVEIIFRYHKIFLGFWDPLGTPYEQNENFLMWGHGYQNWVRRVLWVHFWRNFWKIFKNGGFGPKFWDTQYKIFFCLIKKIFLQTLVEIIFRYHKFFFRVLGPPGAPLQTKWKFLHVRSWVSK